MTFLYILSSLFLIFLIITDNCDCFLRLNDNVCAIKVFFS